MTATARIDRVCHGIGLPSPDSAAAGCGKVITEDEVCAMVVHGYGRRTLSHVRCLDVDLETEIVTGLPAMFDALNPLDELELGPDRIPDTLPGT